MVKTRILGILLLLCPFIAAAQHYYVTDTVTEHNNFGTFYHDRFEGRKTANGEIFDQNKFTAAHWKIKLGTMVMVTNKNSGLQVIVKVNDRCPKHNVLDMSHRAANAIGIKGCQKVTVRILPDGYEERWAAQETMFDSVHSRLTGKDIAPTTPETDNKSEANEQKTTEKKVQESTYESLEVNHSQVAPSTAQRYNLILATDITHGEAFDVLKKVPKIYQEKVIVESLEDSTLVKMILDVKLPKAKASNLRAALKHSFPDITMTPCE